MKYLWPNLNPSLTESIARGRVLEEARILIGRPELTSAAQIDALLAEIAGAPPAGAPAWTSITGKPTTIAGYLISDAFTQAAADALYSALAHTHTFASLTSKPSTIAGYGATADFNSLGDVRWLAIAGIAASATKLQTARLISGMSFDGTADITIPAATARFISVTAVGTGVATAETDLMSHTLPTLANGDTVEILVTGNVAGVANTKTIRFYIGASTFEQIGAAAGVTGRFFLRIILTKNGTSTHTNLIRSPDSFTTGTQHTTRLDVTELSGATIKMTGQTTNAADEVTQETMVVSILKA